ncbi:hypothetical protein ABZP36_001157 [Zizania latifolia]
MSTPLLEKPCWAEWRKINNLGLTVEDELRKGSASGWSIEDPPAAVPSGNIATLHPGHLPDHWHPVVGARQVACLLGHHLSALIPLQVIPSSSLTVPAPAVLAAVAAPRSPASPACLSPVLPPKKGLCGDLPPSSPIESAATSRIRREDVVRVVAALLRWLQHHPTPAPEPIYLLVTLKSALVSRFEHSLRLPRSPFPSISLLSDRLSAELPNDIEPLPSPALQSLPAAARRGLVLVDSRLRVPSSKGAKGHGGWVVPVNLADQAWAESRGRSCGWRAWVKLRGEGGTCRVVRVRRCRRRQEWRTAQCGI